MTRIFIEGLELDLSKGLSNQITYAIDDLQNLDSKATTFSKTIVLPGTTNNNKLLGNIFEFTNSNFTVDTNPNVNYNFNASKSAVCRIEVDGLQIVKGIFRLLEIIRDGENIEYECAVFGELGGLISALGNKRLEDLDFSAYNHNYTLTNIYDSWQNPYPTSYIYPLIDYGAVSDYTKHNFIYKTFRPALFAKEYLDKIMAGAGYTYVSNFFNTAFFKRLIIPNNSKALSRISSTSLDVRNNNPFSLNDDPTSSNSQTYLQFPTQTTMGAFTTANNYTFKYNGASTLTGLVKLKLTNVFYQNLNNGLVIYIKNKTQSSIIAQYGFTYEDDITLPELIIEANGVLNTNDEIEVTLNYDNQFQFFISWDSTKLTIIGASNLPVPINLGEPIIMNDTLPRGIFQKDFFTSLLKMFNLLVTEDKYNNKKLYIEPYVDFWSGEVKDWSDKLDRAKPIRLKPMSEATARYYELKWKQDSDFYNESYRKKYNEGYGDMIYDNGLEFAKDKETVEVIFSSSTLYGTTGEDKVYPAIYKKSTNNNVEDPMEHNIRIMQVKYMDGLDSVSAWNILDVDGLTILDTLTTYCYAGHLDNPNLPNADLNFGATKELYFDLAAGNLSNNLFNVYYAPYLAEITDKDSRLLSGLFKLSNLDIYNLDFSKFIYIDGALYRLSKVIDYSPEVNDTTKCELLRVINKVY